MNKISKKDKLIKLFASNYPEPVTALNFSTPFELLIATVLSAQTTDIQVNKVTKNLFKVYNKPKDFVNLKQKELEKKIKSIGLYKNKSKYIINLSKIIIDKYNGKIPDTRDDLMKLPGVGRKTANVVLGCAFKKNTIPVDTHVLRVSNRLGLCNSRNTYEVEKSLMEKFPPKIWLDLHHWLIIHGRNVCKARNPLCNDCFINKLCDDYKNKGAK